MDLKVLLAKLDKLDQRQILTEGAAMVEEVLSAELELLKESYIALMERVRGKELEALRNVKDEEQRKKQIAILAVKNNYPGLFDPVTGKWVDYKGNYAWFGPYKAEVEQMEKDGLVPPEAHTSAFWGLMGKDERDAYASSQENRSKYDLVDDAGDIIDKANQSKGSISETLNKGDIAKALTEGFGYSFIQLNENISEKEHNTLKAIIEKLNDIKFKDDADVQAILKKYQEYVLYRDQLIAKIKQALAELKGKMPPAKPLAESRSTLTEEIYLVPHKDNTVSAVHLFIDADGNVVEYAINEDIEALGRGLGAGLTFGWSDNAVAKMISMYKGTPYGDELAKQLAATEAAKARSPTWYMAGQVGGVIAGSTLVPGSGLVKGAAMIGGQIASDKFVREPHNLNTLQQAKDANAVKKVQKSTGQTPTGNMDATSVAAVKNNGAQVGSARTQSAQQVEPELADVFKDAGVKDLNGLIDALKKSGAKTIEQVGPALANLLKIEPAPAAKTATESIIYSSMSESERMSYLRNRMSELEEGYNPFPMLGRLLGIGGEAALLKIVANLGKEEIKLASGEVWKKAATGMWENSAGRLTDPASLGKLIQTELKTPAGQKLFVQNNPMKSVPAPAPAPAPAPVPPQLKNNAQAKIGNDWYVFEKNSSGNLIWKKVDNITGAKTPVTNGRELNAVNKAALQNPKNLKTPKTNTSTTTSTTTTTPPTPAASTGIINSLKAKFPKVTAALSKTPTGLTTIAKYGWSKKWWIAIAAIIAAGYALTNPSDTVPTQTDSNDSNSSQQVVPPVVPTPVQSGPQINGVQVTPEQLATIQKYAGNIKSMMKQLEAMYPADKETKDMRSEVDEALKGIPDSTQSSQQTQSAQQVQGAQQKAPGAFGFDSTPSGYGGAIRPAN